MSNNNRIVFTNLDTLFYRAMSVRKIDYYDHPHPVFHEIVNGNPVIAESAEQFRRYFGIELEVHDGNNKYFEELMSGVDYLSTIFDWYYKDDMSIEEDFYEKRTGRECISQPRTLESWKCTKRNQLLDLTNSLDRSGFTPYGKNPDQCALHVHVSRDSFGKTEEEQSTTIAKVIVAMDILWPVIQKIARREENEKYARRIKVADVKDTIIKYSVKPEDAIISLSGRKSYRHSDERYKAINTTNDKTIEFRVFRSTLDTDIILATIEICDWLIEFAKRYKLETLLRINPKKLTEKFIKFDKKKYPELWWYFATYGHDAQYKREMWRKMYDEDKEECNENEEEYDEDEEEYNEDD